VAIQRRHGPEGSSTDRPVLRLNVVITTAALALATVAAAIDGRPIRKIVFVPNRIINVVA